MAKKKTTRKKITSNSTKTAKKGTKTSAAQSKETTSAKKKDTTAKSSVSKKSPKKSVKKKTTKKTTAKVSKIAKKTTSATKKAKSNATKTTKKTPVNKKKAGVKKNTVAQKTTKNSNVKVDKPLAMVDSSLQNNTHAGQDSVLTQEQMRKVKTKLTKRDLQYFRDLLTEKRAEITGNVASLDTTRADAISNGNSHMPLHMADIGTDSYDQDFMMGLVESEKTLLNEINEALARIDNGTYGVCVVSGNPIAKARLEIQPWAKYCIEVARQRDD